MKRGEFSREQKWGIAAGAVVLVGGIALGNFLNGSPEAPNAAVAAAEQPSDEQERLRLNELGIPEKPCGWTSIRPQDPKLIEGRWQVKIDGRCREQPDGEVRAYTEPSDKNDYKILIEGGTPNLTPGETIVAICAKKGDLVVTDAGATNEWIRTEFPHGDESFPAWVSAADAGFVNAHGPVGSPPPAHMPALPNCPRI